MVVPNDFFLFICLSPSMVTLGNVYKLLQPLSEYATRINAEDIRFENQKIERNYETKL